jgi:ferrochelatase
MLKSGTAVLLLNVGTPEGPERSKVRKFLAEFLNDKRVIDIPWLLRKILVNLIIIPLRATRSAKLYKRLWTEKGSPLLYYGLSLKEKLQQKLGNRYIVEFAARYRQPGIKETVDKVLKQNVNTIIVFPLFPQYASSTTGTAVEKLLEILKGQLNIPAIKTIVQYYDNPLYLGAMTESVKRYDYADYDHILMSFHGLPLSQVNSSHDGKPCKDFNCTNEVTELNSYCYNATCHATSRLLAEKLSIDTSRYTVCFQSRIAKNWLSPYTDDVIIKLARVGKKKLLVICPSFTADCLETIIEVGQNYRDLFLRNGGEKLTLVESLNDSEYWVDAISGIISEH